MIHLQPLMLALGNSSLHLLPYLCSSSNASGLAQWSSLLTQETDSQTYTLPSQVSPQITAPRTQSVHNKTSKQQQEHEGSGPIHEMPAIHLHRRDPLLGAAQRIPNMTQHFFPPLQDPQTYRLPSIPIFILHGPQVWSLFCLFPVNFI